MALAAQPKRTAELARGALHRIILLSPDENAPKTDLMQTPKNTSEEAQSVATTQHATPAGILCSALTPFDNRQRVDSTALKELLQLYAAIDLHGVFILGTAAEAMLLTGEERRLVANLAVDTLGDNLPIILHCGVSSTPGTIALAGHARSLGIANMAAIAPYYYGFTSRDVEYHYQTLAESLPDVNFYIYNNPERVGYEVPLESVVALTRSVSNIRGVKDTGDSLARIIGYLATSNDIDVYTGNNHLIYPSLVIGARGAVSALAAVVPELISAIYGAWTNGELSKAMQLQLIASRLMKTIDGLPYLPALKFLGRLRGLPTGSLREPFRSLESGAADSIRTRITREPSLAPWLAKL